MSAWTSAQETEANSWMKSSSRPSSRSRPEAPVRRRTYSPPRSRSSRCHSQGSSSDAETEEETIKANHARPRSPSSRLRHLNPSGLTEAKRASAALEGGRLSPGRLSRSRHPSPEKDANKSRSPRSDAKPDVLGFLDSDSPALTGETIQRTVEEARHWKTDNGYGLPTSPSAASSTSHGSFRSGHSSQEDTEAHTSPEPSVDGDIISTTFTQTHSEAQPDRAFLERKSTLSSRTMHSRRQAKDREHRYGTPEMPRGNANLPHLPPNALTPRVSKTGQGHVKHLPRAEKLPLTGYELLAARLSAGSGRGMPRSRRYSGLQSSRPSSPGSESGGTSPDPEPEIKPMYRRFEALNHRLLLHLQDELSELEEQLHRLDTADTQTRRLQNCILPASRRAEYMSGGELQWHKTDILGKIGFKLGQYNHVLSSFRETQNLPSPDLSDVESYRTYLATENPIAEIETRFLEPMDDLVSLARPSDAHRSRSSSSSSSACRSPTGHYSPGSDEAPTPTQRSLASYLPKTTRFPFAGAPGGTMLPTPSLSPVSSVAGDSRPSTSDGASQEVKQPAPSPLVFPAMGLPWLIAMLGVLLPVLIFRLVDGFLSRMAIVLFLVAGTGVLGQLLAVGGRPEHQRLSFGVRSSELLMGTGVYGGFMAFLAAVW